MAQAPRKSAAQWAELVAEFQQGDETEKNFCQRHGFLLSTFRKWRYRFNRAEPNVSPSPHSAAFIKVACTPSTPVPENSAPIVMRIGHDITLECPTTLGMDSIAQLARAVQHGR